MAIDPPEMFNQSSKRSLVNRRQSPQASSERTEITMNVRFYYQPNYPHVKRLTSFFGMFDPLCMGQGEYRVRQLS
jgi:hypothetical protein